jgi:hypothetical protein
MVVFDGGRPLADGTLVEVAPVSQPEGKSVAPAGEPTWAEVLKDFIGKADGLPSDMADNHDHYIHGTPKR